MKSNFKDKPELLHSESLGLVLLFYVLRVKIEWRTVHILGRSSTIKLHPRPLVL